jgi:hypothetical protein
VGTAPCQVIGFDLAQADKRKLYPARLQSRSGEQTGNRVQALSSSVLTTGEAMGHCNSFRIHVHVMIFLAAAMAVVGCSGASSTSGRSPASSTATVRP